MKALIKLAKMNAEIQAMEIEQKTANEERSETLACYIEEKQEEMNCALNNKAVENAFNKFSHSEIATELKANGYDTAILDFA